jgi:hypothetical protein
MCLGAAGADQVEQSVCVIATVCDDVAAFEPFEQIRRCAQIMGLAGGQREPHGEAFFIDYRIDLRTQSSTRTADGVILTPLFPPAACWWARIIELSISAIDFGDFAAKISKIRTQTPALAHRLNRL